MKKINKIDELLNDDIYLEKYISEINQKQVEIPLDLNQKIMSKVNRKKKKYYTDICKIAACLIFSLVICRTDFIMNDKMSEHKNDKPKTSISINEKLSEFCKWISTPLEIEKEEK